MKPVAFPLILSSLLATALHAEPANLAEPGTAALGDLLEDCIDDQLELYFVLYMQRYGKPEDVKDTLILYNRASGTIQVAMFGSAETADDAKKRLESRKKALDYAVSTCAKDHGKATDDVYATVEMIYTQTNREEGKQVRLLRWFRGRWELL